MRGVVMREGVLEKTETRKGATRQTETKRQSEETEKGSKNEVQREERKVGLTEDIEAEVGPCAGKITRQRSGGTEIEGGGGAAAETRQRRSGTKRAKPTGKK